MCGVRIGLCAARMQDEQRDAAEEHEGQQVFHDVVRQLWRDVQGVGQIAEATAGLLPARPPQSDTVSEEDCGQPGDRDQSIHRRPEKADRRHDQLDRGGEQQRRAERSS